MTQCDDIRRAALEDLSTVNDIVTAAVLGWPMAERLKRVALRVLTYDAVDLREMEVLLAEVDGLPVGVAAWDPGAVLQGGGVRRGALLHGLYVVPEAQGCGIGAALQRRIATRAAVAGCDALVVKSERVSVGYFERCGYRRLADDALAGLEYPYLFALPVDQVVAIDRDPAGMVK
jgi:GNAT superfamily N-acetyltransferase